MGVHILEHSIPLRIYLNLSQPCSRVTWCLKDFVSYKITLLKTFVDSADRMHPERKSFASKIISRKRVRTSFIPARPPPNLSVGEAWVFTGAQSVPLLRWLQRTWLVTYGEAAERRVWSQKRRQERHQGQTPKQIKSKCWNAQKLTKHMCLALGTFWVVIPCFWASLKVLLSWECVFSIKEQTFVTT